MIGFDSQNSKIKHIFFTVCCLLFTVYCLLLSCGKKGDPTLKSYEKPEPPSGPTAIHRESDIILSWEFPKDKEPTIKEFHLMKSTGGDFEKLAFLEPDKRSYIDTSFKIDSEYIYKIISQNLKGVISNNSNIIHIVPKAVPSPPRNILFRIGHDSLILNWESAGDGILYNIYKSEKKGLYSLTPVNKEPIKGTSFKDNLDIKRPVYYTIRSLVGSNIRDEGSASGEIEIDPSEFIPSSPSALQAVVTEENIYLIWKEVPEMWVVGYRIYREINEGEGFVLIGETQTPSFIDKDNPLIKRNYRITALGPSKEGPPAEIRDVVFIPYR
jgi:hypothetical protein